MFTRFEEDRASMYCQAFNNFSPASNTLQLKALFISDYVFQALLTKTRVRHSKRSGSGCHGLPVCATYPIFWIFNFILLRSHVPSSHGDDHSFFWCKRVTNIIWLAVDLYVARSEPEQPLLMLHHTHLQFCFKEIDHYRNRLVYMNLDQSRFTQNTSHAAHLQHSCRTVVHE